MKCKNNTDLARVESNKHIRLVFKFQSGISGTVCIDVPEGVNAFDFHKVFEAIMEDIGEELDNA